ncbi:putative bifunctional diguanylate cyclase/phosphodiesterase [Paenibacillus sp. 1P07SE]|uniref:putative bifunctional diguanylate cyclase/phosphodiesterase n=1 Tax=Paenibacillus sp. 1P07SE TaxID=3132209 RepID=UPI0039A6951F
MADRGIRLLDEHGGKDRSYKRMVWTTAGLLLTAVLWTGFVRLPLPARTSAWLTAGVVAAAGLAAWMIFIRFARRARAARTSFHYQLTDAIMDDSPLPVIVADREGQIVEANNGALQMMGYDKPDLIGKTLQSLLGNGGQTAAWLRADSGPPGGEHYPLTLLHRSGLPMDIHVSASPMYREGSWSGTLLLIQDTGDRKRHKERIRYMAYYDDMTGLPNRSMFMIQLTEALERAGLHEERVGLLYLDLDHYRLVNDSFGREFGDMLLMQVAERLTRRLTEQDMTARMEGDEFAVLLMGAGSEDELVTRTAELLAELEEPFELQGFPLHITASVGIAVSEPQDEPGQLMIKAEKALSKAKDSGRNGYILYSEAWSSSSRERLTLQHEIRQAIQRQEFILYYQPQYDLSSGEVVGLEALLRWQHPERGLVPPGQFIPVAEDSGMIVQLGDWVLEEACRQNKLWQDAGLTAVPVSVNLSIRQFLQQNLAEKVAGVLERTGLSPELLDLEITESMTMDVDHATHCLLELTRMGINISIDDFGTGYSSLNYLKKLPIGRLKIDRSFVRDIQHDPGDAAIVAAIIAMAHNLNMQVIAEGVENEGQLQFLKRHGCDEMQGYFWSAPVTSMQVERLLQPV